eukprot:7067317-Alexandrium_andersonii.AAC.1
MASRFSFALCHHRRSPGARKRRPGTRGPHTRTQPVPVESVESRSTFRSAVFPMQVDEQHMAVDDLA